MKTQIFPKRNIRLMLMDEAGFGRINKPAYCWCPSGIRPIVPCQQIRQYVYVYGAVDPISGDSYFMIAPTCNTQWTNKFLELLSAEFPEDYIALLGDNASWHNSQTLITPDNIEFLFIPPYTPEMNPIEQIWKEIRKSGFKNTMFNTLDKVVEKLSDILGNFSKNIVKNVCGRDWIVSMF